MHWPACWDTVKTLSMSSELEVAVARAALADAARSLGLSGMVYVYFEQRSDQVLASNGPPNAHQLLGFSAAYLTKVFDYHQLWITV